MMEIDIDALTPMLRRDGRDASQAAHREVKAGTFRRYDRQHRDRSRVNIDDDAKVIAPVERPRLGWNIGGWITQAEKRRRIAVRRCDEVVPGKATADGRAND